MAVATSDRMWTVSDLRRWMTSPRGRLLRRLVRMTEVSRFKYTMIMQAGGKTSDSHRTLVNRLRYLRGYAKFVHYGPGRHERN